MHPTEEVYAVNLFQTFCFVIFLSSCAIKVLKTQINECDMLNL